MTTTLGINRPLQLHPWARRLLVPALFMGLATACETTTEPLENGGLDTEAALLDYEAVDAVLASSALKSLQGLGQQKAVSEVISLPILAQFTPAMDAAEAQELGAELVAQVKALRGAHGVLADALISSQHRGKTFVFDEGEDDYVVDPDRTGAPSNGVRFILYRTDVFGHPLGGEEIGYADLIDEGDTTSDQVALRLEVVEGNDLVADYGIRVDRLVRGGTIRLDGFFQDRNDRLDFDFTATGSEAGNQESVDLTFSIRVDSRKFSVDGELHGMEGDDGDGSIDITVRHRDGSIRVDVENRDDQLTGTFYLNGSPMALVSGDPDDPTFTDPDGAGLSADAIKVLVRSVRIVGDVMEFFEDLAEPVGELIFLAVVL